VRATADPDADGAVPIDVPEGSPPGDLMRRFGLPAPRDDSQPPAQREGLGSGFIVSSDGLVLTNAHVVANAVEISVKLADRREFRGKVLGMDPLTDVAVVRIDARDLPTVQIGDASTLQVGQWVLAIGAPFGFDRTATQGIVSALRRSLPGETYVPFIQTDVPINPGNSGGPLFDTAGRVVGINSQIYTRSGGYMGLSFAIPIDVAVSVANELAAKGRVDRGWLGLTTQELTQDLARAFGIETPRGVLVAAVAKGSPAQAAGVRPGDIVVAFGSARIDGNADLPPLIARSRPGERTTLTVVRQGREQSLHAQIGRLPEAAEPQRVAAAALPAPSAGLNITVSGLDARARRALDVPAGGVLVRRVGPGRAADAGVQPGDVLMAVADRALGGVEDLRTAVAGLQKDRPVPLLVKRQGADLFLALRPAGPA
jgi:serine protease Do